MDPTKAREAILELATALGFDRVGFARAGPCHHETHLRTWLEAGRHGEMAWMARQPERRTNPDQLLPGAKTVISLLTFYDTNHEHTPGSWSGRVSRYAWGSDYHNVLGRRLRKLARAIGTISPGHRALPAVDHRPILEKEWATRAGLGWIGKHTNLITEDRGSWFFLSELVTDLDVAEEAKPAAERCGRCTECLDRCPTGAIVAPYEVDARRCISYLTIELRGPIPRELRPLVGEWIFGCDVCQDVCPWNRFSVPVTEPRFRLDEARFDGDPAEFLALTEEAFLARFEGSPVRRAGRDGFLRNVCVSLGNRGARESVPPLARAIADDSALVREHAAWALGRIGGPEAIEALRARAAVEIDERVVDEIVLATAETRAGGNGEAG